jgi:hypothetical protein
VPSGTPKSILAVARGRAAGRVFTGLMIEMNQKPALADYYDRVGAWVRLKANKVTAKSRFSVPAGLRLLFMSWVATTLLSVACMAPVCRTSEIERGTTA